MVVTFMSDLEIKDFILHGSWYHTILLFLGQGIPFYSLWVRVSYHFTPYEYGYHTILLLVGQGTIPFYFLRDSV